MAALIFIVDTLFSLYIGVYLIRLLMQLVRADFRNQVAEGIMTLTNPLIMPLRRVLPPMGKLDTAMVVAIVLLTAAKIAVLRLRSRDRALDEAHGDLPAGSPCCGCSPTCRSPRCRAGSTCSPGRS